MKTKFYVTIGDYKVLLLANEYVEAAEQGLRRACLVMPLEGGKIHQTIYVSQKGYNTPEFEYKTGRILELMAFKNNNPNVSLKDITKDDEE